MKIAAKPHRTRKPPASSQGKAPLRLPQRSEAISGSEEKGIVTPIAAAQKKKPRRK